MNDSPNGNVVVWEEKEIVDGEVYALPNGELVRAWVLPDRDQVPEAWDKWWLTPAGYGRRLNMLKRLIGHQPGVVGLGHVWLHAPARTAGDPEAVDYQLDWMRGGEVVKWAPEREPVWTEWRVYDLMPTTALGRRAYWEAAFAAARRLRV